MPSIDEIQRLKTHDMQQSEPLARQSVSDRLYANSGAVRNDRHSSQSLQRQAGQHSGQSRISLPPLVPFQRRRMAVGDCRLPQLSGSPRHGRARLHLWPAARVRRRSHRGDRQRDPQIDAGRPSAIGGWPVFLARPLDDRRRADSRNCGRNERIARPFRCLQELRRCRWHLAVGVVPVRHRDRQHHRPRLGLANLSNRQERTPVRGGRPRPHARQSRSAGSPVSSLLSSDRAQQADVPLGVLFGLGFDTATEVGLLGISATQASQGLSIWSILVFPALFTAGSPSPRCR